MAGFKFKYATVLRFRELKVNLKGAEVSKVNREINLIHTKIKKFGAQQRMTRKNITSMIKAKYIPIEMLKLAWERCFFLRENIDSSKNYLQELQKMRLEKIDELTYWMKQKKVMENLQERHLAQHKTEEWHEERKLVDDIVTAAYARKVSTT
jgi:flagellar export protein FliJ